MFGWFKKNNLLTEQQVRGWTDEEMVLNLTRMLPRVKLDCHLIQDNDGFVTHQSILLRCGQVGIASAPQEFDWPMEPLPYTEDTKERKKLN